MKRKLSESTVSCPLCGGDFLVEQFLFSVAHFGEILLTKGECKSCGYTTKDILPISDGNHAKKQIFVASVDNLNARVVRSSTCKIKIPELSLTVEPVHGEAFITNVEGLLLKLLDKLESFKSHGLKVDSHISFIKNVLSGKGKLTIIFEDPSGLSFIGGVKNE